MVLKDKEIEKYKGMSECLKKSAEQLDIVAEIAEREKDDKFQDGDEDKAEAALGIFFMKMIELSQYQNKL